MNKNEQAEFWDWFFNFYQQNIEIGNLPIYLNLVSLGTFNKANENDRILELSVGCGMGFKILSNITKAKLYGGDISQKMVDYTKSLTGNNNIFIIDNENLSLFEDNYFRNVFSNFSLHLVYDPLKMLKETKRVLDYNNPDSCGIFSVWGRQENSRFFNVIPLVFKKYNLDENKLRSNFHLSDKDTTIKLCKEAGFQNVIYTYSNVVMDYKSAKELLVFLEPWSEILDKLENSLKEVITNEVENAFQDELTKQGGRISYEVGLIYVR